VLKQQRFFASYVRAKKKILVKNAGVRIYTICIQPKNIVPHHAMSRVATINHSNAFAFTNMVSAFYSFVNAVIETSSLVA
jgi:hypothetical protein